jgi:hypothetical protein
VPRVRPGEAANPAPPTVQRIRLRFAKRGRLRFLSHRDVARSFERAVRRAGVPVAHSHGYSPHPRLSWVGAAPTGTASEAEYLEIGLTRTVDPAELVAALDAALPDGIDVLEAAVADGSALAERIDASRWLVELPGVAPDQLGADVGGGRADRPVRPAHDRCAGRAGGRRGAPDGSWIGCRGLVGGGVRGRLCDNESGRSAVDTRRSTG